MLLITDEANKGYRSDYENARPVGKALFFPYLKKKSRNRRLTTTFVRPLGDAQIA